jgi:hypothetical protein
VAGMLTTKAQQTINTAGHTAHIHGMTFSYSTGEMVLTSTEHNDAYVKYVDLHKQNFQVNTLKEEAKLVRNITTHKAQALER